jgi:hypothetical protein
MGVSYSLLITAQQVKHFGKNFNQNIIFLCSQYWYNELVHRKVLNRTPQTLKKLLNIKKNMWQR